MSKQIDFYSLAQAGVRDLKPYVPGKPVSELQRELGLEQIVKLASNENPLGPSDRVKSAVIAALDEQARYPDASGFELKDQLAEKHGLNPNQITLGNGSNDVLVLLAQAFLTPQHNSVFSQYAFAVYPIATKAVNAEARIASANPVSHSQPLGHDLKAMAELVDENTRLIFIANPNNPTGTWIDSAELEAFVANVPDTALVVVDEAYTEYVTDQDIPDTSKWLSKYPNLVVSKTFSKAYGLAGFRVGYCLSHPDVADLLNRIRPPFNVNSLALVAAQTALQDEDYLQRSVELNETGKAYLSRELKALGLTVIPSATNFLLVDMGEEASGLNRQLLEAGVIVRPVGNYGLPNHLRVSIGLKQENEFFVQALQKILK
ncbi:MAG: histidinol-phosphate transaminase [Gammaproteobacteria bacterium]|nr:histidinol-phosphate transaminase [Gammaproteobacteria bacterium]NNC98067.1 histidinol-phosphate transaminase [Gammaproteobacteria bacterium]NNM14617.1 histidinol-phosphate transaminase [Gammaproteobacteria bacterium]